MRKLYESYNVVLIKRALHLIWLYLYQTHSRTVIARYNLALQYAASNMAMVNVADISYLYSTMIESIKTTSMEDVSTRVLEKLKNV